MENDQERSKMKKISSLIEEIQKRFKSIEKEAKHLLKDSDMVFNKLDEAREKASNFKSGHFGTVIDDFFLMIDLVRAYLKKEYKEIPVGTIIAVLAAILYVINPLDVVPDAIPGIGQVDDFLVIGLVLKQTHKDLQAFKEWKQVKEAHDYEVI